MRKLEQINLLAHYEELIGEIAKSGIKKSAITKEAKVSKMALAKRSYVKATTVTVYNKLVSAFNNLNKEKDV